MDIPWRSCCAASSLQGGHRLPLPQCGENSTPKSALEFLVKIYRPDSGFNN
jgi:hypothetical protein